ncbi:hypothetical protein LVD17_00155 [Fulvivirga ulvae]|uniref:hypothetical protein n=1 Tax=Fulvivirga ulvae TaxID=2904245 RepID=UPI001F1A0128|nr:hypothetical protein [Fulvivirga ulvae]UII32248.1 hypothetical protein LVD17_00155 [Fulvivirga ulvae]
MKLVELVTYFRKGGSFDEFCRNKSLDIEAEVIEVYMEKPFDLGNDLAFFEIEKTEGNIEYTFNGVTYFNLFDFYYFLDVIDESCEGKNSLMPDDEIAQKLLSYAIHDA